MRPASFTTALPLPVAAAATASIAHLKASGAERAAQRAAVAATKAALTKSGLPVLPSDTHIVPVMVGDAELASAQAMCCSNATGSIFSRSTIQLYRPAPSACALRLDRSTTARSSRTPQRPWWSVATARASARSAAATAAPSGCARYRRLLICPGNGERDASFTAALTVRP